MFFQRHHLKSTKVNYNLGKHFYNIYMQQYYLYVEHIENSYFKIDLKRLFYKLNKIQSIRKSKSA